MVATNRWQVLVLVTSLALIGIAMASHSWFVAEDGVRIGLISQKGLGQYGTPGGEVQMMAMVVALLSVASILGLVLLIVKAWRQSKLSTVRLLVLVGLPLQIGAAIVLANTKVDDVEAFPGVAWTLFLVGSMGALIGAAALVEATPP